MDRHQAEQLIDDCSWEELLCWVAGLADERSETARKWYRSSLRTRARMRAEDDWRGLSRVVQVGLALTLADTPEEASKSCVWGRNFAWTDEELAVPRLGALLARRDRDWAAQFIALATGVTLRGESRRAAGEITAITAPAIAAHDLPVPGSGSFAHGWAQLVSSAHIASTSANRGSWTPVRLSTLDDAGSPRPAYDLPTTLHDVLAATPKLADTLRSALATPDAFVEWNTLTGEGWEVDDAISRLIDEGILDRSLVIADGLSALSRVDKPSAQRVIAKLLRGASFAGADVHARRALVTHLMPSVHGSVTAVLLSGVLETEPEDDLLLDVGTVILARKEKAQKHRLLEYLAAREPSDATSTLLRVAVSDEDTSFAAKAQAALNGSDGPGTVGQWASVAWDVRWDVPVIGRDVQPFQPWPAGPAGFDAARSDTETWARISTNAAWLDLVVRYAHRDLAGLRRSVADGPEFTWYSESRVPPLLQQWCAGGSASRSYTSTRQTMRLDPQSNQWITEDLEPVTVRPPGYVVFTDRLVEETLGRLGRVPELLSTPSHADGTVTLDDLVRRLRVARRHGVAPYDLVQALLRLEPTRPEHAGRLEGLEAELSSTTGRRSRRLRRQVRTDAIAVIRYWIQAGGLPARPVEIVDGAPISAAVSLPLPPGLAALDGLAGLCAAVDDANARLWYMSGEVGHYLGVVPHWPDAAAALLMRSTQPDVVGRLQPLGFIAAGAGRFGAGVHHLLATAQSHPRQDCRLMLVDRLLEIARQGRLDPELLRDATLAAYDAGSLSLTRLASTWELIIRAGGLRWVWPAATSVLDVTCRAERKPVGLADLFRALAPAVGTAAAHTSGPVLPEPVRKVAGQKAASKAVAEARAFVAAADGALR